MQQTPDPRYPVGTYEAPAALGPADRDRYLQEVADTPLWLREVVTGLTDEELDTPYRVGGWSIRQIVHHVADSHVNWYTRTKLAVTEPEPAIKPYDADQWSELEDARQGAVEPSLLLLEGLHARWVLLFRSLTSADWRRRLFHPERGWLDLVSTLPLHAWHGRHHVAQIAGARERLRVGR